MSRSISITADSISLVLLQLHRLYFIRALSCPEEAFNRRHKYAPSVVAVFMSASRMIATVQELFQWEPEKTTRILWYWSNAFSATVSSGEVFVCDQLVVTLVNFRLHCAYWCQELHLHACPPQRCKN